MISVDLWLNETTRHADVILPAPSPLEQPHHDDLILNFAINSIANYSPPVFAPQDPDRPQEWEILIRLTGLCTGTPAEDVDVAAIDDGFFDYMAFTQGLDGATIRSHYERGGPERILDLTLRTGPVRRPLRREPRRRHAGQAEGPAERHQLRADGAAAPRDARYLGPQDPACPAVPARRPAPARGSAWTAQPDELVLVSRRHLRSNNSWLHNVATTDEGQGPLHPADAPRRRETARRDDRRPRHVTSSGRQIDVPVEVTDAIKPGVVSMPHGWGHGKPGTRMAVANDSPGVNTNVLSPPDFLDEPSGNGALNGIPVTVAAPGA